jgi:hypothetical protein
VGIENRSQEPGARSQKTEPRRHQSPYRFIFLAEPLYKDEWKTKGFGQKTSVAEHIREGKRSRLNAELIHHSSFPTLFLCASARNASFQSLSETAGVRMSSIILPLDLKEPIHDAFFSGGGGGSMTAIGFPYRVTMTGRPVFLTLSRTASQVALNFEMVITSLWFMICPLPF